MRLALLRLCLFVSISIRMIGNDAHVTITSDQKLWVLWTTDWNRFEFLDQLDPGGVLTTWEAVDWGTAKLFPVLIDAR